MRLVQRALAVAAIALALPGAAHAFPDKPIRLIVPFPPGGGTDALAREVANRISTNKGWNIVIENRPGAGGNLGVDLAARAKPDGHTLVLGQTSNLAINPTLYPRLPYDPERDLTPIGLVAEAPLVLVVAKQSPHKQIDDIVKAAKEKPEGLNFGSPGNGTVAHLAAELFQKTAGIRLTHIPYKGAAQGANDLIGGQVDMYMSSIPTLIGHIRSGTMRPVVVTAAERAKDLPDTPTFAESGYKNVHAVTWFGLMAPAKLPPEIVSTLSNALQDALKSPETQKQFESQGAVVRQGDSAALGALIRDDRKRWGEIVKEANARID